MIPHGTVSGYKHHGCRCDLCVSNKKKVDREYYLANRERKMAQAKAYYEANKEVIAEKSKQYREENAEAIKAQKAKYAKENSARLTAKAIKWVKENPDRYKEATARYRDSHREELRASANARYAHLMATDPERVRKQRREYAKTPTGRAYYYSQQNKRRRGTPYTKESRDWIASLDRTKESCTYCGIVPALEIDHIVPINKGGTGERHNLTPVCRTCNARKGNLYLAEFLGFVEPERICV